MLDFTSTFTQTQHTKISSFTRLGVKNGFFVITNVVTKSVFN